MHHHIQKSLEPWHPTLQHNHAWYDTLNRLTTLANSATGSFGFSYDALSRRTQMSRPNGINTNYSYDNLSRLLSVLHQSGTSTIDGASYTLDSAGNRTAKTDDYAGVTSDYTYDALYELTQVTQGGTTTESYSYDPVGNRTASLGIASYTTNSSNEMTANSNASYTYDSNGNTLTKTDSTGTTTYAWDYENRLTSVTLAGTGGTVTFKYDPFGRRIEKISPTATSIFAYDSNNLVETVNGSGGVVARYTQQQSTDEPLAMLRGSTTGYYEQDGLGSVTSLTNAAGVLAQTYTYDSFGNTTGSSGSLTNFFRYTDREFDTETNLYDYRARYYVPVAGRFVNEDPSGFYGGFDFYGYVKNDPVDFIDPTGLKCEQITPWTVLPFMAPPGWNPSPYETIVEGPFWVRTGWSFASLGILTDYTHCICQWVATHTRVRKFYKLPITEQAEFKCDTCPPHTELRTRQVMKYYEIDSPGTPFLPSEYGTSLGSTFQAGENTGSNPRNKNNDGCTCLAPAP